MDKTAQLRKKLGYSQLLKIKVSPTDSGQKENYGISVFMGVLTPVFSIRIELVLKLEESGDILFHQGHFSDLVEE
ncbi:hypothetical protein AWW68_12790 [Roseivirga spongicola]|uniref:Uncharacterized protein n=1 Tax=Roseivirga spongicola TaxID=333140 RepID=A0A150X4A9_9BACT|nr:hypothetical protein AWW68_12790 [Roseivirga spongicola]